LNDCILLYDVLQHRAKNRLLYKSYTNIPFKKSRYPYGLKPTASKPLAMLGW